jgi:hypothetical protein
LQVPSDVLQNRSSEGLPKILSGSHKVVLSLILLFIIVLSCLDVTLAQPTLDVSVSRGRLYFTPSDSVVYDQSLRGNYSWEIAVTGKTTTPVAIEVLTPYTFRAPNPMPNSTSRQDSQYRYRWDGGISDVNRMRVYLVSDLQVMFSPGFDSERTVSPEILNDQTTTQTLQVKVAPREDISAFDISVSWDETPEANATLVPNSDLPRLEYPKYPGPSARSAFWKVESPAKGKEYEFSAQFRTENRLYPKKIAYRPRVSISFSEPGTSQTLTGSTVTAEDALLGKVNISTPSQSRWNVKQFPTRRVSYARESAVWGEEYTTTTTVAPTTTPATAMTTSTAGFTVTTETSWLAIPEGYVIFVAAAAVLAAVSLILFRRLRTRARQAAPVAYCSNCGHEIASSNAYCPECGVRQAGAITPQPTRSVARRKQAIEMRAIYLVIMFISLAVGASIGYLSSTSIAPSMARTITETETATTTMVITSATTTTAIPTLSPGEASGLVFVKTLNEVYQLDLKASPKPQWELFTNRSMTSDQVSPDGRYLAYDVPKSGIYIFDGESRTLLKREESTITCLSWSPDGSRLSYKSHSNYVLELSGETRLIDTPRSVPSYAVVGQPWHFAMVWAEFGCPIWTGVNTLLYQRFLGSWPKDVNLTCSGSSCSGRIPADTSTVATLTTTGVKLHNLAERWFVEKASANAVLLRDKENGEALFLARSSDLGSAGTQPKRLEFCDTTKCRMAYFSPDGRQIAFLMQSPSSVVLMDVAAPETRTTFGLGSGWVRDFAWSPSGGQIILQKNDMISILDLQTRKETIILAAASSLLMWATAWSRGADYLAVLAVPKVGEPEEVRPALCIVRVADSAFYPLPSLPAGTGTYPEILSWLAVSS